MDESLELKAADYIVVAATLLLPLGIGILFAIRDRKNSTREKYLMGNRQMSLIPVTLSLFVTFQSSVSLLGFPGDLYMFGPMICVWLVAMSLSYAVGCVLFVPVLYPLKLTSMYEYLQLRYESEAVRKMSTIIGMTQTVFYMAVVLFAPALALQATVSLPLWMSVIIVGGVGTVYTAIGGIKSVVWTDTFQTFLFLIGMLIVLIKGYMAVGGLDEALDTARSAGRLSFDHFGPDPRIRHTWGGLVIGGTFVWLTNVFNQSTIQRVGSMRTLKDAKLSFLIIIPLSLLYGSILLFTGILIYAYFDGRQCDPLKGGFISTRDQLVPFYVLHAMQDLPGMAGVFMASLFSGTLSTFSSGVNALSANTVEDILKNQLRSYQESTVTLFTKAVAVMYGVVITGLAYGASFLKGNVVQLAVSIFGAFGSPVLGMFLFGMTIPWTNKYGALVGGVVTLSMNIFLTVMSIFYGRKPVPLPPASIAKCYSDSSFTTVAFVNSSLLHSNLTPNGSLAYDVINQSTTTSATGTHSTFSPTTTSLNELNTKNSHDFGFFFFDISYEWGSLVGLIVFCIVGLLVSWLTRGKIKNSTDPRLLVPCCRALTLSQTSESDFEVKDSTVTDRKPSVVAGRDTDRDSNLDEEEMTEPMITIK